jgi:signal transduction histidine kinase
MQGATILMVEDDPADQPPRGGVLRREGFEIEISETGEAMDAVMRRARSAIEDMILLDDALLASRTGSGGLAQELIDMDELVRAEAKDRRAHDAVVGYARPCGELAVLGDRVALRRVVANLLDNAIRRGRGDQRSC